MTKELAIRILTGDVLGTSEQTQEAVTMAVKALSEPDVTDTNVGDTIYREEAIKEIAEYLAEYLGIPAEKWIKMQESDLDEAKKLMRDARVTILPSAQSWWIPCSERLPDHPENDDYYLVTIQCEHYDGWDDYVTGFAEWTKHGWDELSCYIGQIKVVAWMPLPEPYKAEGREV